MRLHEPGGAILLGHSRMSSSIAYTGSVVFACPCTQIRQYFMDDSFYAADVTSRGFCDKGFPCEGFSPSSATVKARQR